MAILPLVLAIPRFKGNEERIDLFTNGTALQTWMTSEGIVLPTLAKFLADNQAQIDTIGAKSVRTDIEQTFTDPEKEQARDNIGLGSAAVADASDFATNEQGEKADTAVQPETLGYVTPFEFGGVGDGIAVDTTPVKLAFANSQLTKRPVYLGGKGVKWRVKDGLWPGYSGPEQRTVILIDGWDATVFGEAPLILFDGANVNEYATIFRCVNGGTLRRIGIQLDYLNLPFTQGVCLSKTATTARFTIDTATCGVPTWNTVERLSHFVWEQAIGNYVFDKMIFNATGPQRAFTQVSAGVYDVDFSASGETALLADVTVGDTYVLFHKVNGYYFCDATDGALYSENCWTRAVAGMSDSGSYVKEFIIKGGGVSVGFGSKRLIATTSDGVAHVNGISGRFDVSPELIDGTSDDAVNLNTPFNDVSALNGAAAFTIALHPPGRMPTEGERMWAVITDGSMVDMGNIQSIVGNVITMTTNLPAGFTTSSRVGQDKWIAKSPVFAPKKVCRTAGGGAIFRGFNPIVRGYYEDVNGPGYNPLCLWPIYNEGPVSRDVDVDIVIKRVGRGRDGVPGAVRFDASNLAGTMAPAGVLNFGRIKVKASDCRPAAVWAGGIDTAFFEIDEENCGYDQWSAVPQPTTVGFFQNANNIIPSWKHKGATSKTLYFQDCLRVRPPSDNVNTVYAGSGFRTLVQDIVVAGGGNSGGAGGRVGFLTNSAGSADGVMSDIGGSLENAPSGEQQGGISIRTRPPGASGQTLTEVFTVTGVGVAGPTSGAWNGPHGKMGAFHLWVDASSRLRIKNGAPTSDTDGIIVGTQA